MDQAFKIYNASAGSGKTYIIAKEYLKLVLAAKKPGGYRQILAITFTNKAVNEMKQRILGSLYSFGKVVHLDTAPPLFLDVMKELELDLEQLKLRSGSLLKEILHNYSFFDISTIDKFTHRLLRTFAKDLRLSQTFEVELDMDQLLEASVDKLLDKAGEVPLLTKVLIDFALEKIDGDRSWDIAYDLNKIGKLLFEENQAVHLERLNGKSAQDFLKVKSILQERLRTIKKKLISNAAGALDLIAQQGLTTTDFNRGSYPGFMQKIADGDLGIDFDAAWKQNFDTTPLYTKICPEDTKLILDRLHPRFAALFNLLKEDFFQYLFLKNAYSNILPLSVLNAINQEKRELEKDKDLLPIASFNAIISKHIKDQPVPFIYERLGEKYRHYFIDEFQDTSEMQWNNLIPLISNALETMEEDGSIGSLLLVGDAKQAIYRWRGGKAEQFLRLANNMDQSFAVPPKVHILPKNYRSHEEIIKFNNSFFGSISAFLNNPDYKDFFVLGNRQEFNTLKGGIVKLRFIDGDGSEEEDRLYLEAVLEIISEILSKGYTLKDICVLTRKRKHGVLLAENLMHRGIPIISSETLLLSNYGKVKFLINLLRYSNDPKNFEVSYELLLFLTTGLVHRHSLIQLNLEKLESFCREHHNFDFTFFTRAALYDGMEYAICQFKLVEGSDAYITFFLDVVLDFEQVKGPNVGLFLEQWEIKKDKLSIVAPENVDAVQLMTVHKSKGLEFPFVIFPYADSDLHEEVDPKLWLPVDEDSFNGFGEVLVSKKKEMLQYGTLAESLFKEEHYKLELDAFNILYVALTRAVQGLFIVTNNSQGKVGRNTERYSGLFTHFLKEKGLFENELGEYTFGHLANAPAAQSPFQEQITVDFVESSKESPNFRIITTAGALWETERDKAISKGNLIHRVLELITTSSDLDKALATVFKTGNVRKEEALRLKNDVAQVIQHPSLIPYFNGEGIIQMERDIFTENGLILRPDRLVIRGNKVSIIDYKTGKKSPEHREQLWSYESALQKMGYNVDNKIIVYMGETVETEFV